MYIWHKYQANGPQNVKMNSDACAELFSDKDFAHDFIV